MGVLQLRFLALTVLLATVCGCKKSAGTGGSGPGGRAGAPPVPVTAVQAITKEMPVTLRAIGNVRPSATVSVKPRVGGLIASVNFKEGEDVEQGDVLFTIDPRPYEVALAQARAAQAQVREQAQNAGQQARRYSSLSRSGAVAKEQVEQIQSSAKASTSSAEAAEAAVKEAEIQLSYCTIKSPISGRTGQRMVDAGNVVTANTTELVVVNQLVPIEVVFAVPEQRLGEIARLMKERELKVAATPAGKDQTPAEGVLTFVDNAVKPASGTIDVKGTFPNQDLALWPGRFVDVTLMLTMEPNAVVVPAPAVQTGQNGQYVVIVKPDKSVEMRPVEMARTLGGEAVIRKGLAAGESIVVDGHLRLTPGARVELKPPVGSSVPEQTSRPGEARAKPLASGNP